MILDNASGSGETSSMNTTDYCKRTITKGRFQGRVCVNATPCRIHDNPCAEVPSLGLDEENREINRIADALEAEGPDELPRGYFLHVAKDLHKNGVRATNPEESK